MSRPNSKETQIGATEALLAGVRAMSPLLLGVVPFGFVVGVAAIDAGISPLQAIAMSGIIFAGAAQLAAIDLISQTAPLVVITLTAIVINIRHVMYSASIAPYFNDMSTFWKWVNAYALTDQTYAIALTEFRSANHEPAIRKWFYIGAAVTIWGAYQISTAAGVIIGAQVPGDLSLGFAVPLTFIALLSTAIEDRQTGFAALFAASIGVFGGVLPFDLGLVISSLVGIAAGVGLEFLLGTFPAADRANEPTERSERREP